MENNINGHNQNRNNVNRHHEQGNGVVQSKTSLPNDVIDERWEQQHLKYGWGKFKPQYVPFQLSINP